MTDNTFRYSNLSSFFCVFCNSIQFGGHKRCFIPPSRPIKIYILCKLITHSFQIARSYANTNFPLKGKRDEERKEKKTIFQCKHVNIKKPSRKLQTFSLHSVFFCSKDFLFFFFDFCLHVHINYLAKSLNLNKNGKFQIFSRKCFLFALKIIELNFSYYFYIFDVVQFGWR